MQTSTGEKSVSIDPAMAAALPLDNRSYIALLVARAGRPGRSQRARQPADDRQRQHQPAGDAHRRRRRRQLHGGRRDDDGSRASTGRRRASAPKRFPKSRSIPSAIRRSTAGPADCRSTRSPRAAATSSAARSTTSSGTRASATPTARPTSSTAIRSRFVDERDLGWSIGGPVGKPGGNNKLFFFYNQEFNPRTVGNRVTRYRVPTALERAGRLLADHRQPGQPVSVHQEPAVSGTCYGDQHGGLLRRRRRRRTDSGGGSVPDRAEHPELVAGAEHRRVPPGPGATTTRPRIRRRSCSAGSRSSASTTRRRRRSAATSSSRNTSSRTRRFRARSRASTTPRRMTTASTPGRRSSTTRWATRPSSKARSGEHAPPGRLLDRRRRPELVHHRRPGQPGGEPHHRRVRRDPVSVPGCHDHRSRHHLVRDSEQRGDITVWDGTRAQAAPTFRGAAASPTRRPTTTTRSATSSSTPCRATPTSRSRRSPATTR